MDGRITGVLSFTPGFLEVSLPVKYLSISKNWDVTSGLGSEVYFGRN